MGRILSSISRLLDAQLARCFEDGAVLNVGEENPVIQAILELLKGDGLTSSV